MAAARGLHQRGVAETAAGRPAAAALLLRAALRLLRADEVGGADEAGAEVRQATGRVLVSLAHAEAEQGRGGRGLRMLDEAEALLPSEDRGLVMQQRGLLLWRLGRKGEALQLLDAAVPLLTRSGNPVLLARTLLNRANLHTYTGRIGAARNDLRRCRQVSAKHGLDLITAKADHLFGSCDLLTGDIPAALRAYDRAAAAYRQLGEGFLAVVAVDKARALLVAGLAREAGLALDAALELARQLRLDEDYAEAELGRAQAAFAAGDLPTARTWAIRAERRFRRRGNEAWAVLAALLRLRVEVREAGPSRSRAERCRRLAANLQARGLVHDADLAELLAAQQLLALGRPEAADRRTAAIRPGGRAVSVENRLLRRLVRAELAEARADRRGMFRELRGGLAVLEEHRARLGSIDLQAGVSAVGEELAKAGLAAALDSARPGLVFEWSERTRAQIFRVRPVLPPPDPGLAEALGELRQLHRVLREAELAGRREPAARARRAELERAVREQAWQASGAAANSRLASLDEVSAELVDRDRVMVSFVSQRDRLAATVIREGTIRLIDLADLTTVQEACRRLLSDLEALTGRRLRPTIARVVRASVDHQLSVLTEHLLRPLRADIGDHEVVVVSSMLLPWGLLPDLRGRPVSATPSASVWVSARRAWRSRTATGVPLLVAGPGLPHADAEIDELRRLIPASRTLRGGEATVQATMSALDSAPLAHLAAHGHHEAQNVLFSRLDLADGPLMAYDVYGLTTPPRHVVLSSCEVGRADVRPGDEVLGFTAALLHAGTASVVSSLTRLLDEAVVPVMAAYHRALAGGAGPAQALASASTGDELPLVCFGAG